MRRAVELAKLPKVKPGQKLDCMPKSQAMGMIAITWHLI
jgi:hypothetical protein